MPYIIRTCPLRTGRELDGQMEAMCGKRRVKQNIRQNSTPTMKYGGGNMMVWGCMGWNRVRMLTEVEERMDAKQYVEIIDQHLPQSMEDLAISLEKAIFQQDNNPKNTSKLTQN